MPTISRSALVMYSVDQMHQLINDIPAYPKFLPDCNDSKVIEQDEQSVTAALLVSKGGLSNGSPLKTPLSLMRKFICCLLMALLRN